MGSVQALQDPELLDFGVRSLFQNTSTVHKTLTLEAQLPIYWVPVLKSLYKFILSITQGPTIWVPGLLGLILLQHGNEVLELVEHQNFAIPGRKC